MQQVVISGSGFVTPPESISNQELVDSFNQAVRLYNEEHAADIANGLLQPKQESSSEFIEKASGIQNRFLINKKGVLDPTLLCPQLPERSNDEPSIQAELSVNAAKMALLKANKGPEAIDAVIMACSGFQRGYPAMSIEVQALLGITGFAFDMNVACSSATFAIHQAEAMIKSKQARAVLIVNPEITAGHVNFFDRDSHFIFGDACTALVLEAPETAKSDHCFEILSSKLLTQFSNNIRNNFGFLNRTCPETANALDKLFIQAGRKVFKEVTPLAAEFIVSHLRENGIDVNQIKRLWLHQANINMDLLIAKKILGRDPLDGEMPIVLRQYANTASAGAVIAFHLHHQDLKAGDLAVMSSFGAGYSVGSVILRKR